MEKSTVSSSSVPSSRRGRQALLWSLVAGAWGLSLAQWLLPDANASASASATLAASGHQHVQELTVERINVVDASGKPRLVIANAERFPDPVFRGKTHARSIRTAAGMVFYDQEGVETGGLATMTGPAGHRMAGHIFDYNHQPTDGIGLMKMESPDGKSWMAGLTIADRIPYSEGEVTTSEGVSRIMLSNRNRDAALEIADTSGKPRIRIGVDANDEPRIEILDAEGKVARRL
ncbi:hypothetical protein [Pseudoxanthomonas koreensis]|uniref:hypothetical protein n=1 Tax=Pseudoxanthomonas koreensis TaxID=266061 RepID=UPI0013908182|nr:hypothetical protein [Pseudoxanthomonas koreensis]KAF1691453.1 hypothetical protein CSC64_09135 [Pseudoxanthomonas koreensis]